LPPAELDATADGFAVEPERWHDAINAATDTVRTADARTTKGVFFTVSCEASLRGFC
jgi:hypothetical protein